MKVRWSSFIVVVVVVGSSIKVPTKFASRVTTLSFFLSIPPSRFFLFRWGKESSRIHYDKPVRFYSLSPRLFLPCLSISPLNFFSLLSQFLRHRSFLFPRSRTVILFSLHLYASAIITGKPTVQIFNLVWQMADLEATFARRDKRRRRRRRSPSFHICL